MIYYTARMFMDVMGPGMEVTESSIGELAENDFLSNH